MEISSFVKPRLIIKVGRVHNQGGSLPMTARIAHVEVNYIWIWVWRRVREDVASQVEILIDDDHHVWKLKDLKRIRQICNARHAWHQAFVKRIRRGAEVQ